MNIALLVNTNPGLALSALLIVAYALGVGSALLITKYRRGKLLSKHVDRITSGEISHRDAQIQDLKIAIERKNRKIDYRELELIKIRNAVTSAVNIAHKSILRSVTEGGD